VPNVDYARRERGRDEALSDDETRDIRDAKKINAIGEFGRGDIARTGLTNVNVIANNRDVGEDRSIRRRGDAGPRPARPDDRDTAPPRVSRILHANTIHNFQDIVNNSG
jgi:hypothetical protein